MDRLVIVGAEKDSWSELEGLLQEETLDRPRCVRYQMVYSFIFVTYEVQSSIFFTHSAWERFFCSLPYSVFSLLCGIWGLPWGVLRTAQALKINCLGGEDVTPQVLHIISQPPPKDLEVHHS